MVASGRQVWEVQAPGPVLMVHTTADGTFSVAGTANGWLLAQGIDGTTLWQIDLQEPLSHLQLSGDGQFVAAATTAGHLHLFDRRGKELWKVVIKETVLSLAINESGALLVVGSSSGAAYLVDRNGKVPWRFDTGGPVRAVAISDKGTFIALGADDDTISYLNSRGELLWRFTTQGAVNCLGLSGAGDFVVACCSDKRTYFLDRTGSLKWNPRSPDEGAVVRLAADAGSMIIGAGNEVLLLNREGAMVRRWQSRGTITGVAISTSGEYCAATSDDNSLYFFSRNGELLWRYKAAQALRCLASTPMGDYLLAGGDDGHLHLFDNTAFFSGFLDNTREALKSLKGAGVPTIEAEVLLQKAELDLSRREFTSALHYAQGAESLAKRLSEKTKPDIAVLGVSPQSFGVGGASRINVILFNSGTARAAKVALRFQGPVEVMGQATWEDVGVGAFVETALNVTVSGAGTHPVRVLVAFTDSEGREFLQERAHPWEVTAEAPVALTKSRAVIQLGDVRKLMAKVQAAKRTGRPAPHTEIEEHHQGPPEGAAARLRSRQAVASAAARASVPAPGEAPPSAQMRQCPSCYKPVQADWAGCPFCFARLH